MNLCAVTSLVCMMTYYVDGTAIRPMTYEQSGDVILTGLFPLHYRSKISDEQVPGAEPLPLECIDYNFLGFRWMQAMAFAIDEVNKREDLLPDVVLGWKLFDTCNTNAIAVNEALYVVDDVISNRSRNVAVVGATASERSIVVSNILSLFDVPQVSYGSTSRLLSNKMVYSSFFRTIPNDDEQAVAIVALLLRHNWTWVGAVAGDDDYGRPGISRIKEEARKRGICVEFTRYISASMNASELYDVAMEVRDFNATVFVSFMSASQMIPLTQQLEALDVTEKVWIASEAWATSDSVGRVSPNTLKGTLGITTRGGAMPGFRGFLEGVSPLTQPHNPFMTEFWETAFDCDLTNGTKSNNGHCDGSEAIADADAVASPFLSWAGTELEKSYSVYLAVYAISHALHSVARCVEGEGHLQGGKCPSIDSLQPWQLKSYLDDVDFVPPGQDLEARQKKFTFDDNGDPIASYKLVSWTPSGEGTIDLVSVGNYSIMTSPRWSVADDTIYWRNTEQSVPSSVCSEACRPGFYKVQLPSKCCFRCVECPPGEFSTSGNSPVCGLCNETDQSSPDRTSCVPKREEFVEWSDPFGVSFCCLSSLGIALVLFTAGVFVRGRATPLVKATNRELSLVLFASLIGCFLTPFLYLGRPDDASCRARMVSFSLSFTFCIAAILVKTLRVVTAFQARIPVSLRKRSKWLGEHVQVATVTAVSVLQVVFCACWLLVAPPSVRVLPSLTSEVAVTVDCSAGSVVVLGCVYGYLGALALAAFGLAFRSRKLPANFNEAKFITFAMLIFFIVWTSFVPAYLTTNGKNSTAVYCIAILASSFSLFGCIFLPKLYVLLATPDRNTAQDVRMETTSHAFRTANSRIGGSTRNDSSSAIMMTAANRTPPNSGNLQRKPNRDLRRFCIDNVPNNDNNCNNCDVITNGDVGKNDDVINYDSDVISGSDHNFSSSDDVISSETDVTQIGVAIDSDVTSDEHAESVYTMKLSYSRD